MKNILVTGASGQLGQSIKAISHNYPGYAFTFIDSKQLDYVNVGSIEHFFEKHDFDFIINCAAYTAVDKAEEEAELADLINHQAVKEIARIVKQTNTVLIHISTDYVFDGTSCNPYIESDNTSPNSVYGDTKLKGELAVRKINPKGVILRTSWVYSEYGNNFVKTMLRLGQERDQLSIVFDQVGTPTYAPDLAAVILELLLIPHQEIAYYHFSNEGVCSWYDFAKAIFEVAEIECEVLPILTSQYPTLATRPYYSVLNKAKIKQKLDITIPYWKESLKNCLERLND